ncbi:MAG: transposase [Pseudomonadota bacterium]
MAQTKISPHCQQCLGFLDNTLERLGNINYSLIRADSGFASDDFFAKLEEKNLNYIIALPMMQTLQRTLAMSQAVSHLIQLKVKKETVKEKIAAKESSSAA